MSSLSLGIVALHFILCQGSYEEDSGRRMEKLIPIPELDENHVPVINFTVYRDIITRFKCIGTVQGEYIKKLSECFSDHDTIDEIKTQSKLFLINNNPTKDTQIAFHRCIGTIKIKHNVTSDEHTTKMLYNCLSKHGIEEYIGKMANKSFTHRERREFGEFLHCLAETHDDNFEEEATDCIQTNPIMFEIARVFRNPFPKLIIPPKFLRSAKHIEEDSNKDNFTVRDESGDLNDGEDKDHTSEENIE